MIVAEPTPNAVTNPLPGGASETAATEISDELHVTAEVRSCLVPSESVPSAVNCRVAPKTMPGLTGDTVMDSTTGAVTVSRAALEKMPEKFAEIAVVPLSRAVASPFDSGESLTAATRLLRETHDASAVMSRVVPSEKDPVAMNWLVCPTAILERTGSTEIDVRTAGLTVSAAGLEDTPANVAVINAAPAPVDVKSPCGSTIATAGADEVHVAKEVMSWVAPPDSAAAAVNCCDVPSGIAALVGVTASDTTASDESSVDPVIAPSAAVIVVVPVTAGDALARPLLSTVATPAFEESHETKAVISCVAPFSRVAVAERATDVPAAMTGAADDTEMS